MNALIWASVVITALLMAAFFAVVVGAGVRAMQRRPATGSEGMVGEVGVARTRLAPEGRVFVHGELWQAVCEGEAEVGEEVRVTAVEGLRLRVEKVRAEAAGGPRPA